MRRRRSPKLLLAAAVACVALAACGHAQTVGPHRIIRVGLSEYQLSPASIDATSGRLTVVAHNFGRLVHNLEVLRAGRLVAATRPIRPGSTAKLTLELSTGTYLLASGLLQDQSLGMQGTLNVS